MNVLMVIKDALNLLGLNIELEQVTKLEKEEKVEQILEDEKVKQLFSLLKLSLRELCTNYMPIVMGSKQKSVSNCIPVSKLNNYIRVKNIKQNEQNVKYKIINRQITLPFDGEFDVYYFSYPEIESLTDGLDFLQVVNTDVVVLGLCAYYCLANGMFDGFNNFNQQYRERAESLREMKSFILPRR